MGVPYGCHPASAVNVCGHRFPRHDSGQHMCNQPPGAPGPHRCICGATWLSPMSERDADHPVTTDPPAPWGSGATPEGALSYAIGHAERRARPGHRITAADVVAGLADIDWTVTGPTSDPLAVAVIPPAEHLQAIEIRPGDLIAYAPGPNTDELDARAVMDHLAAEFHDNATILLDPGSHIEVYRPTTLADAVKATPDPGPDIPDPEHEDELYLTLHGARERLCRLQVGASERVSGLADDVIVAIDRAGSTLPQWSRFDRMPGMNEGDRVRWVDISGAVTELQVTSGHEPVTLAEAAPDHIDAVVDQLRSMGFTVDGPFGDPQSEPPPCTCQHGPDPQCPRHRRGAPGCTCVITDGAEAYPTPGCPIHDPADSADRAFATPCTCPPVCTGHEPTDPDCPRHRAQTGTKER